MHVTSFFQDKYKLKKAKKYIVYVTVRRPTARALCQVWEVRCGDSEGPLRAYGLYATDIPQGPSYLQYSLLQLAL